MIQRLSNRKPSIKHGPGSYTKEASVQKTLKLLLLISTITLLTKQTLQFELAEKTTTVSSICPKGCSNCTSSGCTACQTGYRFQANSLIQKRRRLFDLKTVQTTETALSTSSIYGTCYQCTSPCSACSGSNTNCTACISGYTLSSGKCNQNIALPVCIKGCSNCTASGCTQCTTGYRFVANTTTKSLYERRVLFDLATTEKTATISQTPTLEKSTDTLQKTVSDQDALIKVAAPTYGTCQVCTQPCAQCSGSNTYCTACIKGYTLSNGTCQIPAPTCPDGCDPKACTASGCTSCIAGRYFKPNQLTKAQRRVLVEMVQKTATLSDQTLTAEKTISPELTEQTKTLSPTLTTDTKTLQDQTLTTTKTDQDALIKVAAPVYGTCPTCENNCATCTSPTVCQSCVKGYTLKNSACVVQTPVCIKGCSNCTAQGCTQCVDGYMFTANTITKELATYRRRVLAELVAQKTAYTEPTLAESTKTLSPTLTTDTKTLSDSTLIKTAEPTLTTDTKTLTEATPTKELSTDTKLTTTTTDPLIKVTSDQDALIKPSIVYGTCTVCAQNCRTCQGKTTYCTGCHSGYKLSNNTCVLDCPTGCATCDQNNSCNTCASGYFHYTKTVQVTKPTLDTVEKAPDTEIKLVTDSTKTLEPITVEKAPDSDLKLVSDSDSKIISDSKLVAQEPSLLKRRRLAELVAQKTAYTEPVLADSTKTLSDQTLTKSIEPTLTTDTKTLEPVATKELSDSTLIKTAEPTLTTDTKTVTDSTLIKTAEPTLTTDTKTLEPTTTTTTTTTVTTGYCGQCSSPCATCSGTATNCQQCVKGYSMAYAKGGENRCIADVVQIKCTQPCAQCMVTSTNCTKCIDGYELVDATVPGGERSCKISCKEGCGTCNAKGVCLTCKSGYQFVPHVLSIQKRRIIAELVAQKTSYTEPVLAEATPTKTLSDQTLTKSIEPTLTTDTKTLSDQTLTKSIEPTLTEATPTKELSTDTKLTTTTDPLIKVAEPTPTKELSTDTKLTTTTDPLIKVTEPTPVKETTTDPLIKVTSDQDVVIQPVEKTGECIICSKTCATCSGTLATNCLSCHAGYILNKENACELKTCPSNTYKDADHNCIACDKTCATCTGPTQNHCKTCHKGFALNAKYACEAQTCPQNTFKDENHNCVACDKTCLTCNGSTQNHCLTCTTGYVLNAKNACEVKTCPQNTFKDDKHNCIACDKTCATCNGSLDINCLTCHAGYILNSKKACEVKTCPQNTFKDTNHNCVACDKTCLTCNGSTANHCKTCTTGYVLSAKNACELKTCPSNTFKDSDHNCINCDSTCLTCNGATANHCLSCKTGYVVNAKNACEVKSCNDGEWKDTNHVCQKCDDSCVTCNGGTQNHCLTCTTGFVLDQKKACVVKTCPAGTYKDQQHNCIKCDSQCATCNGSTANHCLTCHSNYQLNQKNACEIQTCPQGQFKNSQAVCQQCHSECAECNGALRSNCTACKTGFSVTLGHCVTSSGCSGSCLTCTVDKTECFQCTGTNVNIYNATDHTCTGCATGCANCINKTTECTKCLPGFYLNGTTCTKCDSNCLECNGAGAQMCTKCHAGKVLEKGTCGCTSPCSTCSGTRTTCTNCITGFSLTGSTCNSDTCNSPCKTCGASATSCTSCIGTNTHVLIQNKCHLCGTGCNTCTVNTTNCHSCKPGFYHNSSDNQCNKCDSKCLECNGPGQTNCTKCPVGTVLGVDGECKCEGLCSQCSGQRSTCTGCVTGYVLSGNTCITSDCNQPCATCTADKSSCLQCVGNKTYVLEGDKCGLCKTGCSQCEGKTDHCISCDSGYYFISQQNDCGKCHSSCATCTGGQETQCKTCPAGTVLGSDGRCTCSHPCQQCSGTQSTCTGCVGGFALEPGNVCTQTNCNHPCSKCTVDKDYCLDCENTGSFLNKFVLNTKTNKCDTCATGCTACSGTTSTCSACEKGYYLDKLTSTCNKCDSSCKECSGPSSKECTVCQVGHVLKNGSCGCSHPCNTCSTTQDHCDSCAAGFGLQTKYDGLCIQQTCNAPCLTCTVNKDECMSCQGQAEYVWDQTKRVCNKCRKGCQQCSSNDVNICSACLDGWVLDKKLGYCVECDQSCGQCDGVGNKACTSCHFGAVLGSDGSCGCDSPCATCNKTRNSCLQCIKDHKMSYFTTWIQPITTKPALTTTTTKPTLAKRNLLTVSKVSPTPLIKPAIPTDPNNPLTGICIPTNCHASCYTCLNTTSKGCTRCRRGYHIAAKTYPFACNKCNSKCKTCYGPRHGQCTSCHMGSTLKKGYCTAPIKLKYMLKPIYKHPDYICLRVTFYEGDIQRVFNSSKLKRRQINTQAIKLNIGGRDKTYNMKWGDDGNLEIWIPKVKGEFENGYISVKNITENDKITKDETEADSGAQVQTLAQLTSEEKEEPVDVQILPDPNTEPEDESSINEAFEIEALNDGTQVYIMDLGDSGSQGVIDQTEAAGETLGQGAKTATSPGIITAFNAFVTFDPTGTVLKCFQSFKFGARLRTLNTNMGHKAEEFFSKFTAALDDFYSDESERVETEPVFIEDTEETTTRRNLRGVAALYQDESLFESGQKGKLTVYKVSILFTKTMANRIKSILYICSWLFRLYLNLYLVKKVKVTLEMKKQEYNQFHYHRKIHLVLYTMLMIDFSYLGARNLLHFNPKTVPLDQILFVTFMAILLALDSCFVGVEIARYYDYWRNDMIKNKEAVKNKKIDRRKKLSINESMHSLNRSNTQERKQKKSLKMLTVLNKAKIAAKGLTEKDVETRGYVRMIDAEKTAKFTSLVNLATLDLISWDMNVRNVPKLQKKRFILYSFLNTFRYSIYQILIVALHHWPLIQLIMILATEVSYGLLVLHNQIKYKLLKSWLVVLFKLIQAILMSTFIGGVTWININIKRNEFHEPTMKTQLFVIFSILVIFSLDFIWMFVQAFAIIFAPFISKKEGKLFEDKESAKKTRDTGLIETLHYVWVKKDTVNRGENRRLKAKEENRVSIDKRSKKKGNYVLKGGKKAKSVKRQVKSVKQRFKKRTLKKIDGDVDKKQLTQNSTSIKSLAKKQIQSQSS